MESIEARLWLCCIKRYFCLSASLTLSIIREICLGAFPLLLLLYGTNSLLVVVSPVSFTISTHYSAGLVPSHCFFLSENRLFTYQFCLYVFGGKAKRPKLVISLRTWENLPISVQNSAFPTNFSSNYLLLYHLALHSPTRLLKHRQLDALFLRPPRKEVQSASVSHRTGERKAVCTALVRPA